MALLVELPCADQLCWFRRLPSSAVTPRARLQFCSGWLCPSLPRCSGTFQTRQEVNTLKNKHQELERRLSTGYSSIGLRFDPQHPQSSSKPHETPVPGDLASAGTRHTSGSQIYAGKTPITMQQNKIPGRT